MSLKQHPDAKLEGYEGPIFPPSLANVRKAFEEARDRNGKALEEAGRKVRGYKRRWDPHTSDHYWWFWALEFERAGRAVVILFPFATDTAMRDGVRIDRSMAIHTKGDVTEKDVEELIAELVSAMHEMYTILT